MSRLRNYFLLISRLSGSQLYYRLIKLFKFKIIYKYFGGFLYPVEKEIILIKNSKSSFFVWENLKNSLDAQYQIETIENANKILKNEFTFLNKSFQFKDNEIDWECKGIKDKLWKYYLHYFEYMLILIEAFYLTEEKKYLRKAEEIVNNWIESTYPGQENAWEPYTISIRLLYWSYLWEVFRVENIEFSPYFKNKFLNSINRQVKFLYANLEKDLANNHYTANGKTLFWIGITFAEFKNSKRYLKKGIEILNKQLIKEINYDGSQYENSTSYQIMTAKDYLEVLIYAEKNNIQLPQEISKVTEKMFDFIMKMMKPNKTLFLLNDSVENYPINVKELFALAAVYFNRGEFKYLADSKNTYLFKIMGVDGVEHLNSIKSFKPKIGSMLLEGSGYFIFREGWNEKDSYFLFDAGQIGPKHNPGHGHADNLSVYFYVNNEDIFIDPGTFEYENGEKRNYYRSTRAHNTIEVNKENQTTFWGSFRAGNIAKTKINNVELNNKKKYIVAEHYGYKRLKQRVIHRRQVNWNNEKSWSINDNLFGKDIINGVLTFQLGENCSDVTIKSNICELKFQNTIVVLKIKSVASCNIYVEKGMFSKDWKTEKPIKRLCIEFKENLPVNINTVIEIKQKFEK